MNMKKLINTLFALSLSMAVFAISDQELVSSAIEMQSRGMSNTEIAKQLVAKGATIEQIQRIQQQYAHSQSSSKSTTSQAEVVEREDNSQEIEPAPASKASTGIYGHEIFTRAGGFQPQMNQATPKNYILGAGDEVIIDIFGASQEQFRQVISPDGNVTIDGYGPIQLSGLSLESATRRLKQTLGSRYQSSQLALSIGQTRSINVQVMGEVDKPGSYRLSAFATPMNALYMAGGVSELGTVRDIKLYRNGKIVTTVDLYKYLMEGSESANTRLEDGDVLVVNAYTAIVSINGRIKRPLRYEMKSGESLAKLLQYAGGFASQAYTSSVRISRSANNAHSTHTVTNDAFETFALCDGDSVNVLAIRDRLENTVMVSGAVFKIGYYGLSAELKTVRDLIAAADGLTEFATDQAILYRMRPDRTQEAMSIDLSGIMSGKTADIELRNEDQLFIGSNQAKMELKHVAIHGEVFSPSVFPYAEGETVSGLILRAGGLNDRASTGKVDVTRRIIDPAATSDKEVKMQTFNLNLNNEQDAAFVLMPYDEVYVRTTPVFGEQLNVTIQGEVLFAGTYAMETKMDRLSDLVANAGGLTQYAFVDGARLLRTMSEGEQIRLGELQKITRKSSKKDSLNANILDLNTTYSVGIDLRKAIANPGGQEDIVLRKGDVLFIPSINTTVKINGEVLFPNTVSHDGRKCFRHYIGLAGGYTSNAKRSQAFIIYANGKVAPARRGRVLPGCEIVVPTKPEKKVDTASASLGISIASTAASLTSAIAVIINAMKK